MALKFARTPAERARRELRISVERTGRTVAIAAIGRIDLATEASWHDQVMNACTGTDDTRRVIVDLTGVTHISWSSTSVLARAHRACARRERTLRVLACGPVLATLQLTRFDEDVTITPTLPRAIEATPFGPSSWLIA